IDMRQRLARFLLVTLTATAACKGPATTADRATSAREDHGGATPMETATPPADPRPATTPGSGSAAGSAATKQEQPLAKTGGKDANASATLARPEEKKHAIAAAGAAGVLGTGGGG